MSLKSGSEETELVPDSRFQVKKQQREHSGDLRKGLVKRITKLYDSRVEGLRVEGMVVLLMERCRPRYTPEETDKYTSCSTELVRLERNKGSENVRSQTNNQNKTNQPLIN